MRRTGFTIVELLIVIVVIAILAAITIVAYNGVQQQATNTKTVSALKSWVTALNLYKAQNGGWPNAWTCLGSGYLYGESGTATSGTAQCRLSGTSGVLESSSFVSAMSSVIGSSLPTPSFVTAVGNSTEWRRGLHYAYGGGGTGTEVYINAAYAGVIECPSVGLNSNRQIWGGNTMCTYYLGLTSDT